MGESDPMTLQTRYRIGKLHFLSDNKEEAMEELGDVLSKQETLLGFDHAEVTKTRDLLNQILAERATPEIFLDHNLSQNSVINEDSNSPDFLIISRMRTLQANNQELSEVIRITLKKT